MTTSVRLEQITKRFGSAAVLDEVSLDIQAGELIAILGPSGCGKTTLLRILAGLEKQTAGRVFIGGTDVTGTPPSARRCGIVFQSYALFPNLSVSANIAFGIDRRRSSRADRARRVQDLLDLIGLPDIGARHPAQLSGGQQQRVALARALAIDPSILLLDEPLSALDAKVRVRLRAEIRSIQQRLGVTTLLVTHDQEEALTMADRVVVMDHGKILQIGTPWQIYREPAHAQVGDFVGSMNLLHGFARLSADQIARGSLTLHHPGGGINSEQISVAFRPEDARLLDDLPAAPANSIRARLDRSEFRGAFCRAYLTPLLDEDRHTPIIVDISLEQGRLLIEKPPSELWVQLPAEHLRFFPQVVAPP